MISGNTYCCWFFSNVFLGSLSTTRSILFHYFEDKADIATAEYAFVILEWTSPLSLTIDSSLKVCLFHKRGVCLEFDGYSFRFFAEIWAINYKQQLCIALTDTHDKLCLLCSKYMLSNCKFLLNQMSPHSFDLTNEDQKPSWPSWSLAPGHQGWSDRLNWARWHHPSRSLWETWRPQRRLRPWLLAVTAGHSKSSHLTDHDGWLKSLSYLGIAEELHCRPNEDRWALMLDDLGDPLCHPSSGHRPEDPLGGWAAVLGRWGGSSSAS